MSKPVAERFRCLCSKCVDFHAHFLQREVFETCFPRAVSSGFGQTMLPLDAPMWQPMLDPDIQVRDMDARGVDVQVLSSCDVVQSRAWADTDEEQRMTRLVNDQCLAWVDKHPARFIGSAVLPLGDMKLAMRELDYVISAGMRVVQLPANFRGAYLGDKRFYDLFDAIRDRGMIAFMHPEGVVDPWYQAYSMWNSIGQSIEEVRCLSSLIYEGVMDRFTGIQFVIAHGGGYMPHYMGRLDRNAVEKPFTTKNLSKKPSDYLSDFYYDSCVYDPRTLELLAERVGIDRLVMGGDYPVAALDPLDFIDGTALTAEDKARIAGGNALALLGIG